MTLWENQIRKIAQLNTTYMLSKTKKILFKNIVCKWKWELNFNLFKIAMLKIMRRKVNETFSKSYFLDDIDTHRECNLWYQDLKTNRNIEFIDTHEYWSAVD